MTFISKEAILIFDQSQIVFMKNILLSKNLSFSMTVYKFHLIGHILKYENYYLYILYAKLNPF